MQDQNLQQESPQQGLNQQVQGIQPQAGLRGDSGKKPKTLVIPLAILGVLLLVGAVGVGAYLILTRGSEEEKESTTGTTTTTTKEVTETTVTTTAEEIDPYEGWKRVELQNMGYEVMVPQAWEVKEELIDNITYTHYKAVFSDGVEIYEIGLCNAGIGDCGICEYQWNRQTLFTLTFLGKEDVVMSVVDCYGDLLEIDTGGNPIGRTLSFNVFDISEGKYQELRFGHSTDDTTLTLDEMRAKYADLKKVLESFEVI